MRYLFTLPADDRGCLSARSSLALSLTIPCPSSNRPSRTHHRILFMLFTSVNLFNLARWASKYPCRRSWSRHPSRHPTSALPWSRRSLKQIWGKDKIYRNCNALINRQNYVLLPKHMGILPCNQNYLFVRHNSYLNIQPQSTRHRHATSHLEYLHMLSEFSRSTQEKTECMY